LSARIPPASLLTSTLYDNFDLISLPIGFYNRAALGAISRQSMRNSWKIRGRVLEVGRA
jgi:hypothetical protein